MKQESVIIKRKHRPAKELPSIETISYEEVGKPWLVNKFWQLSDFIEEIQLSKRVLVPGAVVVKKGIRLVAFCLIAAKDLVLVILYVAMILLEFVGKLVSGVLQGSIKALRKRRRMTSIRYDKEDDWWRNRERKPVKKNRTIRVIVEVEDY